MEYDDSNRRATENKSNPSLSAKPTGGWVWRCNDTSLASGQTSLLAIMETLLALAVYVWLGFHFERQWWLLGSAVAAPILLMKSFESKRLGLILLRRRYYGAKRVEKKMASGWFPLLFISALCAICFLLTLVLVRMYPDWSLWQIAFLNTLLLKLIIGIFVGMCYGIHLLESTRSFHINYPFLSSSPKSSKLILAIYLLIVNLVFDELTVAVGVWLQSLLVRVFATVRHPLAGLRHFPQNWREILWGLDFTHLPELIPGAANVSLLFDSQGLMKAVKQKEGNRVDRAICGICLVCWYVPTLLWRWSLKSTLWIWWPLTLLLTPPLEGLRADAVRDFAAVRINSVSRLLAVLAVLAVLWLSLSQWPDLQMWIQTLLKALNPNISNALVDMLKLAPPHKGLFEMALWLCCGVTFAVWWQGDQLKAIHKKPLEEEKAFLDLPAERQALFIARAQTLARWYTAQVVAFIILGYSIVLSISKAYYPQVAERFLPAWLLAYL